MKQKDKLDDVKNTLAENPAVLIYFYNDDCPPCFSLRPKVENLLANVFPKMDLVWVNSKLSPEIPANFGVFANPSIILFFDGKETRRFSKYVSVSELEESVSRYYSLIFEE